MSKELNSASTTCPVEQPRTDRVLLAHGEGGRLMRGLLRERIRPILKTPAAEDAVFCPVPTDEIAITTDGFVVSPIFFPGGDIGRLAVYGTVNDLAVSGSWPAWITLSLILEEGLPLAELDRVLHSIAAAAEQCEVSIVAGDTKVVPRGMADKLYINTTGVGLRRNASPLRSSRIEVGDVLIASGPIGRHGVAIMAAREELGMIPPPESDCAALHRVCSALHARLGERLRTMRDATRGGVSAVLHEWSESSGRTMKLSQSSLPVSSEVRGVCELLGLDPLYVACEGTFLAAVAADAVDMALDVMRGHDEARAAQVIGSVTPGGAAPVVIERMLGVLTTVDEPSGAPLPRIC